MIKLVLPNGNVIELQTEEAILELDGIIDGAKWLKYSTNGSLKMLRVKVHYAIMVWAGVYIIVGSFFLPLLR